MAATTDFSALRAELGLEAREAALEAIRSVLTEENTDALIAMLEDYLKLPFWLSWLPIGKVLDRLLPDVLLRVFEDILG